MNTENPMAARSMPSAQVFRMVDARTAPTAKKSCGCGGCGCGGKGKGRRAQSPESAQLPESAKLAESAQLAESL